MFVLFRGYSLFSCFCYNNTKHEYNEKLRNKRKRVAYNMQQFTVPQFIDVEDKIFGPITSRQFVIMLTSFVIIGACYKLFDFSLFLTMAIVIFFMGGVVAFLKINGMPFHFFVLNFLQTSKRPFLRVWNNATGQETLSPEKEIKIVEEAPKTQSKMWSSSRLTELSLIVDTQGAYRGENGPQNKMSKIKSELDIKI
ncbi:hypothetical protein A2303_02275 [Candidatus Falkowbacteria bacterium RIFOXYB2_FULL_47_14]|nr:MAG: hypothetical protein A2468_01075 [Candidatus Falkowbacteria bacterium RIFOXYC2_FULL_46_15]OGF43889.1 MAG: hypothetical protein A2303_02275 [Candidatus Falkowbacteria bacterium RIFOXYB2_FULL_47_14]